MQSVSVIFYDGLVSKPHHAELIAIDADSMMVSYDDQGKKQQRLKTEQMTLIGALGKKPPVIELDNDARIEFLSHEVPDWLPVQKNQFQHRVWKLEKSPALIVFSVIVVVALAFAVLKWGIPATARLVAFQLPENTLMQVGNQAEKYIVEDWTRPSQLPQSRQQQIRSEYLQKIAGDKAAKLIFRQGSKLGANAVALPNHTIIMTDELVKMTASDQEILAVLAHEQGHLVERHSLQQALSSLGMSILYIAMTGDSSDLLTSLPIAIIGSGYSRKFEQQADFYALQLMDRQKIDVSHFADFLQRMSEETATERKEKKQQATGSGMSDIFSSHPATAERIRMVRDFEKQQKRR
ncbi:M48 family metallopeptidase [Acinetobacter sp. WZC-1]|uniref:M48 family metallopeptidase n=1 Tax=Acinetobacter sp. WZC-1 TaxID=3459034 RepID=UPI00403DC471